MLKYVYDRQTAEAMARNMPEISLTAEGNTGSLKVGDEIRLAQNNGRFCLLDENEQMIDAQICANVPMEEALTLSLVKAAFTIRKIAGNVLKAEMKIPAALVHQGQKEWCCLY